MPLSDQRIMEYVRQHGMIDPFVMESVRKGVVSYGLSSSGYDMRCSSDFIVYHAMGNQSYYNHRLIHEAQVAKYPLLDPKHKHSEIGEEIHVPENYYLVLQPGDYALTNSFERLKLPRNIMAIFIGKSTYARKGLIVNVTPGESGWEGWLTIELANPTNLPIIIYPEEGILQAIFFEIAGEVHTSYADKIGKYQGQEQRPVESKIE